MDKAVGIFIDPSLPKGIGMGEIHIRSQSFCDFLIPGKLQLIVGSDRYDLVLEMPKWATAVSASKSAFLPVNRTITVYKVLRSTIVSNAPLPPLPPLPMIVSPSRPRRPTTAGRPSMLTLFLIFPRRSLLP